MYRTITGAHAAGIAACLWLAPLVSAQEAAPVAAKSLGGIERNDPRFDKLIPAGAKIEILAEGFDWSEGTAWDRKGGSVVFSDVPRNVVHRWKSGDREASVFLKPSGYTGKEPRGGEPGSNGLLFDKDGKLILCQHGDRRIARLEADGSFTTLADRFEGKRFNSPNDAVLHSDGSIYFTDPSYGLEGGEKSPLKEIPFNGVYRLAKDGKVTLITKEMSHPNGIGLSPDEKTLYVANSDSERAIWMAFDLKDDGTVANGRVFFDATRGTKTLKGLPDGLKVDKAGNVFATGPGGVLVFDPDGTHLGTLVTGVPNGNVAFGGEDGSTLFIAADMYLARVKTTTKGQGF
ncbi:SMP-30/gluconolactonase/LRE family protein [Tundrisphaera sp. TA3]|uniref:SMP-30/gluconolactonase/LRE family protein n=1 Tax=Tundrisphaera sp. TA3 TaxID=3435775 RepID=UPI003EBD7BA7